MVRNMPRKKRPKPVASPVESKETWPIRRWWAWGAVLAAVVLLLGSGGRIAASYARRAAVQELQIGAVTAALDWISWASWFRPSDGRTDLMAASCYRHLQDVQHFDEALEAARRKGAPAVLIEREMTLGLIRAGGVESEDAGQLGQLIEAGLPPDEVAQAFVLGHLLHDQVEEAKRILDAWAADRPDEAAVAYIRGVYWEHLHQYAKARAEFETTLIRQPRHELARMALARLLERQGLLEESLPHFLEWATGCRESDAAQAGLARILRKTGRIEDARAVLESQISGADVSIPIAAEIAQIEFDSANYEKAADWIQRARSDRTADHHVKMTAASALGLAGDVIGADRLFAWADDAYRRDRKIADLSVRLHVDPNDVEAVTDLKRQSSLQADRSAAAGPSLLAAVSESRQQASSTAADLYLVHCSACHGVEGYGDGRAARHLHPRPRDLRNDHSRLVSSESGVASVDDMEAVLRLGMPGTAMRAFDELPSEQIRILAEETLRLRREGVRERFVAELKREGDDIDEDEVCEVVEFATTPGEPVQVPPIGSLDDQSIARGKDVYVALGCNKCHGDDGRGTGDLPLFDEQEKVTMPRNLVNDPFKGGREPASIYRRIFIGMPGTPHPSCGNVPEGQLVDLVQYCRSITNAEERVLTNYQRLVRDRDRVNLAALDEAAVP